MDYFDTVDWRGRVLLKAGMTKARSEFFVHAGTIFLIDYAPDARRFGARIDSADEVQGYFSEAAARFQRTLERYYHELCSPGDWADPRNIGAALDMASSATRFVRRWAQNCSAIPSVAASMALGIFNAVKVHYGRVATSRVFLEPVELAEANAEMMRAMTREARAINRECNRIVA